jgi:hypothetical protein
MLTVGTWQSCNIYDFGYAAWQEFEHALCGEHPEHLHQKLSTCTC